jgi:hypothetical protein
MNRPPLLPVLLAALLMVGCGPDPAAQPMSPALGPQGETALTTSAPSYRLQRGSSGWSGSIDFTFTNRSAREISLLNCRGGYGLHLEKRVGEEWVPAWRPVMLMCLSQPIRLAPGQSRRDTIPLFAGPRGSNTYPQFEVDEIDGIYRIVVNTAYWNYDHGGPPWGQEPPLELRVSNPFEIRSGS